MRSDKEALMWEIQRRSRELDEAWLPRNPISGPEMDEDDGAQA